MDKLHKCPICGYKKYRYIRYTDIHEATVVREKGLYLNGSIFLIDGGEDEYIQER